MKNKYLEEITTLLERVHSNLSTTYKLELKNCFGAVAGYIDGHIFITCGTFGVALKLPKETLNKLFREKDIKHLKYFPKGHVKKNYAVLPNRILENEHRLRELVDESMKYALSLGGR